ncbi:vitamin K epoxide reductase family protein [Sphingobacterium sp.]|uniref:vitamin K epoxide reductase family protein n=1 Tax=Sphingobacterium sp. TaxID=341027 RepID=UPI0028971C19|nr:vitamin K epoxide reductase family protein [Sphingobacterium sp.]
MLRNLINTNVYQNNLTLVCQYILNHYRIKNTFSGVSTLIDEHTEYPSLLSIIDTLSEYGIESAAIRKGDYNYNDFELPFICSIQQPYWPQACFTVVTKIDGDEINYLDPVRKIEVSASVNDFSNIDKDIVLLVDATTSKDELYYQKNIQLEKRSFLKKLVLLSIFVIAWSFSIGYAVLNDVPPISAFSVLFFLLNTIGSIVTLLLLWHDIDAHNPFLKQVCGGQTGSFNCDAVLKSKGAFFIGLSWSVIGFSYFTTMILSQLLFGLTNILYLSYWALFSLLVVPYTLYSVYYQWKTVKQWCPLCLMVQGVLFLSAINSAIYIYFNGLNSLSIFPLMTLLIIGGGMLSLSASLVPVFKGSKENQEHKRKWHQLRYSTDIFQILLQKQPNITLPVEGLGVQIGNLEADHEIIKVCNPYCGPCAKAHPELEELIRSNNNIKVRVIFTATGEDNDVKTAPVKHLLAIQERDGHNKVSEALDDWYLSEIKDYTSFAERYPMNGELERQKHKIEAMRIWCDNMKIRVTPTFYINGHELPDSYRINDLKHILKNTT